MSVYAFHKGALIASLMQLEITAAESACIQVYPSMTHSSPEHKRKKNKNIFISQTAQINRGKITTSNMLLGAFKSKRCDVSPVIAIAKESNIVGCWVSFVCWLANIHLCMERNPFKMKMKSSSFLLSIWSGLPPPNYNYSFDFILFLRQNIFPTCLAQMETCYLGLHHVFCPQRNTQPCLLWQLLHAWPYLKD